LSGSDGGRCSRSPRFMPDGIFHASGRSASKPRKPETITSWVCPKQYLAPCIKAAFSRNITRVKVASVVERAVPTASLSPFAPSYVIAILAVGISRFPGRTKDTLGRVPWSGDYMPGHRWPCQHRKKDCGNANQSEFRHPYLLLVPVTQVTKCGCDGRFRY
jgi:hypothetical protein